MAKELVPFDYSRQIAKGMDYHIYMQKALIQDSTRTIANAIRDNADRQIKANAVIGVAQIAAVNNQTSVVTGMLGNVNNTLKSGFDEIEYRLGELGVLFTAGSVAIIDATFKMSEAICDRLDVLADIANNPRRTEAREFYRDGARAYLKGFYEEARDYLKQALEKDKTDYRSWYLLGIMYLRGKGEYSDVINLDDAIIALANTAKYISPEIAEYNNSPEIIEYNNLLRKYASVKYASAKNRSIVIKSYDEPQKHALIKEVRAITGLGLKEAKDLVELTEFENVTIMTDVSEKTYNEISRTLTHCGASLEPYMDMNIPDIPNPKPLASGILFYLGQAKRFKSYELEAAGKLDEARVFLLEAQKDYEKSWAYSDKMLEARYNTARCKVLLGDTEGALSDLVDLIKMDKAYSVKLAIDSDFSSIGEQFNNIINKLKKAEFIPAKNDYEHIQSILSELALFGVYLELNIPSNFCEELPYFDILDYAEDFKRIIPIVEKALNEKKATIAKAEAEEKAAIAKAEAEEKAAVAKAEAEEKAAVAKAEAERKAIYDKAVLEFKELNNTYTTGFYTFNYKELADKYKSLAEIFKNLTNYNEATSFCIQCESLCSQYYLIYNEKEKKERVTSKIDIILNLCFSVVYLWILFGTDIIRTPWTSDSDSFVDFIIKGCSPMVIYALASVIIMKPLDIATSSDGSLGLVFFIITVLVQTITVSIWLSSGFFSFIFTFIFTIIVNILCLIPALILVGIFFKDKPVKIRKK